MKVLIIGGAGMIGRKLGERLARDGELGGRAISELALYDVVPARCRLAAKMPVSVATGDLPAAGEADKLIAERPEMIFHLAAIVSGEAEQDFDKGYRINMDGTRAPAGGGAAAGPQAAAGVRQLDCRVRRAVPRGHRRRVLQHAAHLLRHAEEDLRAAGLRLQPQGLPRRHQPAAAHHLRAAGQAQQGGIRVSSPTSCASRWRVTRRCCRSPKA